jgi:hypothetical protein
MLTKRRLLLLLIIGGPVLGLAVLAYTLWPRDPFAFLRRFHPRETLIENETGVETFPSHVLESMGRPHNWRRFDFKADPKDVEASFPPSSLEPPQKAGGIRAITLADGVHGLFLTPGIAPPKGEVQCIALFIEDSQQSWLARTWSSIVHWFD